MASLKGINLNLLVLLLTDGSSDLGKLRFTTGFVILTCKTTGEVVSGGGQQRQEYDYS